MWRRMFARTRGRVPWAGLLWLAPAAALAALLVAGYVAPDSGQINQFAPTPPRWYVRVRLGTVDAYHFGATVPDSTVPSFARMNRHGGARARGELDLGESRLSAVPGVGGLTQSGYVHQGGGSATPFTRWSVPLWSPFFVSWLLVLPAALAFRRHRERLRRGAGLCAQCAYDLRGNESGVCPECGSALGPMRGGSADEYRDAGLVPDSTAGMAAGGPVAVASSKQDPPTRRQRMS